MGENYSRLKSSLRNLNLHTVSHGCKQIKIPYSGIVFTHVLCVFYANLDITCTFFYFFIVMCNAYKKPKWLDKPLTGINLERTTVTAVPMLCCA